MLDKFSNWLISRSPKAKHFVLSQKNIYIFPSKAGFAFFALLILILLTAINYQNSLVYLVLFFLGALFFLSIWVCFLNLSGLSIETQEPGRCFENEPTQFLYRLKKAKSLPLALSVGETKMNLSAIPSLQATCQDLVLISRAKHRGLHHIRRIYIESRFPFGLVVAWTWLKLDMTCLVYPQPVKGVPDANALGEGEDQVSLASKGEPEDLKNYQHGDPVQRIVWKKYATTDQLVIKEQASKYNSPDWVDWDNYSQATENRLRHLSYDVCQFSEEGRVFGLRLPNKEIAPDSGELHKQNCLDALALYGY